MPITQSRLNLVRAAVRPSMKGRMLLSGPSGAGKTYTALLIGEYLAGDGGRILHIDTEKESSLTYADVFTFEHLRWNAPFDPHELAATIMDAGGTYDVVIIDSFSHFWRKQGGILDIAGGKFTGWKEARPAQEDVQEAILETDAHVIACCRSKMEHVQGRNEATGKIEVTKIGLKAQQDDDFEYEVNVSLEVDMQHNLAVSKSRTNAVPVGKVFTPSHAAEFASQYRDWLAGGEPVAERKDTDELAAMLNTITDPRERYVAKAMFVDAFGRPEFLLVSRMDEAKQWVVERLEGVTPLPDRPEGEAPPDEGGHEEGDTPLTGTPTPSPAPDGPTTDATTQEGAQDPTQKALDQVAELEARAARSDAAAASRLDESPAAKEARRAVLIGQVVEHVKQLTPMKVNEALAVRALSTNGSPKKCRDALVDFWINVAEGRTADPTTCPTCGGYQTAPPPFLEDAKRCECPI